MHIGGSIGPEGFALNSAIAKAAKQAELIHPMPPERRIQGVASITESVNQLSAPIGQCRVAKIEWIVPNSGRSLHFRYLPNRSELNQGMP